MPSSDSDDFESADEGHGSVEKKGRKKRLSSSNYSDNTVESDQEPKKPAATMGKTPVETKEEKESDGWGDGWDDIDPEPEPKNDSKTSTSTKVDTKSEVKDSGKSQDTGWDDFDDWGNDEIKDPQPQSTKPQQAPAPKPQPEADIKAVTDRLAESASKSSWGWGWGVDSLLSTATAGISTITNQVSQGISTVLETGIGAPDPEELARKARESEAKTDRPEERSEKAEDAGDAFQLGSLLSGVTKFVETTGMLISSAPVRSEQRHATKETIGKKTMEVLQDGDPGLAKKRAMLGLDPGDKPVLSQVLREAKARADEEDRAREMKREAKEVHYENLFDDFEGLVHLEALEMLSRQVSMRIEERIRSADPDKRQDIKETLQQVAELCEMPEEEEEDEETDEGASKADALHERLQTATTDIGLKLQFQPLVKQYTEVLDWLSSDEASTDKAVYKRCVSGLAAATAAAVEVYHKAAEMLLVKTRRSTADEADALTQMTVVLTKHISELATLFTEKLNSLESENKEQINTYITNIFLEAGNSSTYIQNAFQLALPILQIGAV
ncbi:protein FAM114A2 [Leguminivora glycinivorella]|uniref:protein FAM114A2 n=1 Tax=Leguminivora glycinivorella TaxID=1035111 RepID=UPI00200FEFDB|nr:protein FAM114A2 [Leguminivora glycinivorella]